MSFYDCTKLLSLQDINGQRPEIFISTSNRNGGKTTYFNRLAVNKWKRKRKKFAVLVRFKYELEGIETQFFKGIQPLFFPNDEMTAKIMKKGTYASLQLNGEECGYALPINCADSIKKISHVFNDVDLIIEDEFQSESNNYCPNEVQKFQSIHTSIARGQGEQVRYVPVILISNPVTLLNPYYIALGVSHRLKSDMTFVRGNGFVLEQGYVESASKAQSESAFNRAFAGSAYINYAAQGVYLNDNMTFIEQPKGRTNYIATIKYNGKAFAIREFPELGFMYCDDRVDSSYPIRIALTPQDHSPGYRLKGQGDFFISTLRGYFDNGCFRFKNIECKESVFVALSY